MTVLFLPPYPISGQDSRFEISENGTLRINNVEVYDWTMYKCVSSTPAGSIEGYARVHVLGMLASTSCPFHAGSSLACTRAFDASRGQGT